jgi:hypothetical protein
VIIENVIVRETGIGNVIKTAIVTTGIAMIDTGTTDAVTVTEMTEEMTVGAPVQQTAKTEIDVRFPLLQNLKQP